MRSRSEPSDHALSEHGRVAAVVFRPEDFATEGSERDRRTLRDRRRRPTRPIGRYIFFGRRQTIRRQTDRKTHLYVDRYGHRLLMALLLILLLSILDAYLTIFHVNRGAQEINPLMNCLIGFGYIYFFVVKYLASALAVFILCIHKYWVPVRVGILCILVLYLLVFAHHVFLVFKG
jgi:hypothetical protein